MNIWWGRMCLVCTVAIVLAGCAGSQAEARTEASTTAQAGESITTDIPVTSVGAQKPGCDVELFSFGNCTEGKDCLSYSQVALSPDGKKIAWKEKMQTKKNDGGLREDVSLYRGTLNEAGQITGKIKLAQTNGNIVRLKFAPGGKLLFFDSIWKGRSQHFQNIEGNESINAVTEKGGNAKLLGLSYETQEEVFLVELQDKSKRVLRAVPYDMTGARDLLIGEEMDAWISATGRTAAAEHVVGGKKQIDFIDIKSGKILSSIPAPPGYRLLTDEVLIAASESSAFYRPVAAYSIQDGAKKILLDNRMASYFEETALFLDGSFLMPRSLMTDENTRKSTSQLVLVNPIAGSARVLFEVKASTEGMIPLGFSPRGDKYVFEGRNTTGSRAICLNHCPNCVDKNKVEQFWAGVGQVIKTNDLEAVEIAKQKEFEAKHPKTAQTGLKEYNPPPRPGGAEMSDKELRDFRRAGMGDFLKVIDIAMGMDDINLKRLDESLAALKDPEQASNLAMKYFDNDEKAKAQILLAAVTRTSPKFAKGFGLACEVHLDSNKAKEAWDFCKQAIEIEPDLTKITSGFSKLVCEVIQKANPADAGKYRTKLGCK